jgi:hypothetical protein
MGGRVNLCLRTGFLCRKFLHRKSMANAGLPIPASAFSVGWDDNVERRYQAYVWGVSSNPNPTLPTLKALSQIPGRLVIRSRRELILHASTPRTFSSCPSSSLPTQPSQPSTPSTASTNGAVSWTAAQRATKCGCAARAARSSGGIRMIDPGKLTTTGAHAAHGRHCSHRSPR